MARVPSGIAAVKGAEGAGGEGKRRGWKIVDSSFPGERVAHLATGGSEQKRNQYMFLS